MIASEPIKVVIVGGSFGGICVINHLLNSLQSSTKVVHITLIEKCDARHNYLGAFRAVVDLEYTDKVWVPYTNLFPKDSGHRIIQDTVSHIYHHHVALQSGATVPFDYIVLATGASNPAPAKFSNITSSAEAIAASNEIYAQISKSKSILVIGGGATGVELAGEIKVAFPDKKVTLVHSGSTLVDYPGYGDNFKSEALRHLRDDLGITVVLNRRVNIEGLDRNHSIRVGPSSIRTSDGETIESDLQFLSAGNLVDTSYLSTLTPEGVEAFDSSSLVDPNKHLIKIKRTMQLDNEAFPHIFAVGDCTDFALVPTAPTCEHAGRTAAKNVMKLIEAALSTSVEDIRKAVETQVRLKAAWIPPNVMVLSTGPYTGVTYLPLFGTWFSCFFSRLAKGKDLVIPRLNKDMKMNTK
ncbi:hypothetical protein B0O80DRAFT_492888 [Mortierella sp. GBAus27b]|nr:Apoptosis-inducing factor 2 [Mortierella sp. GBA43]KAI8363781.1 hypothetical protein B0O80DRAFT_492888 [Mortierella sp. GBAus27b]